MNIFCDHREWKEMGMLLKSISHWNKKKKPTTTKRKRKALLVVDILVLLDLRRYQLDLAFWKEVQLEKHFLFAVQQTGSVWLDWVNNL